eukprot:1195400-Prorocentrum_minimum.AAC.1
MPLAPPDLQTYKAVSYDIKQHPFTYTLSPCAFWFLKKPSFILVVPCVPDTTQAPEVKGKKGVGALAKKGKGVGGKKKRDPNISGVTATMVFPIEPIREQLHTNESSNIVLELS